MTLFIAFNSLSWRKSLWNLSEMQVADCFLLLSQMQLTRAFRNMDFDMCGNSMSFQFQPFCSSVMTLAGYLTFLSHSAFNDWNSRNNTKYSLSKGLKEMTGMNVPAA